MRRPPSLRRPCTRHTRSTARPTPMPLPTPMSSSPSSLKGAATKIMKVPALQFEVLLPHEDDTKMLMYEVYQDDAAFDVHRNGRSIAQWREDTAVMGVKVNVTRCALVE